MDITDPQVEAYCTEHSTPLGAHLDHVAAETHRLSELPGMLVGPLEGGFLAMLVAVTGARRVLEIGTFTGYSALAMATALPPDGTLVTCELSEEHAAIARRHVEGSDHAGRIDIRVGPASDTVAGLDGSFDLVFIDADKTGYAGYYEAVLPKLAERGLIVVDNVLWGGRVVGDAAGEDDESTVALRSFNDMVRSDGRVVAVMLPVRDGMTLVRRRTP